MSTTGKDLLTDPERPGQLTPPDRVFYEEGVLLDARDFRAEQSYHRGRLARVLTYLFGTGTAAGLEVDWLKPSAASDPDSELLRLKPGLAIDRLGRLIEVPRTWCIRLNRWYEWNQAQNAAELNDAVHNGSVIADVFLRFLTNERGRTPGFASGPFDALDATVPSRLRDAFAVDLILRSEPAPNLPQGTDTNPSWPNLSQGTPEERREALHNALLGAWQEKEGTTFLDAQGQLQRLAEHVPGHDPTAVFLARVSLPVDDATLPPERRDPLLDANKVVVDNLSRRFAYPAGALAALHGIRLVGDDTP